jgi:hypothetical protein
MDQSILVIEQIDAGTEFIRDFNDYVPISVALWVKPIDAQGMYLYLASDKIDSTNFDLAYGEVLRRLAPGSNPWLDPFQIKVVNSADSVARDALRIRQRFTAPIPTRYNGSSIGGIEIDEAYIYPPVSAMKPVS